MHSTHTKPHHNVSAESLNEIIYRANFGVVSVCKFIENSSGSLQTEESENLKNLVLFLTPDNKSLRLEKDASCVLQFSVKSYEAVPLSSLYLAFHTTDNCSSNEDQSFILHFNQPQELKEFLAAFRLAKSLSGMQNGTASSNTQKKRKNSSDTDPSKSPSSVCEFESRTEEASALQYFQFYGFLFQQQNMMQDYTRTATYQRSMHDNAVDFKDKVIMDVGAGSGILSFFAVQAGARRVYAIEASSMAIHCQELVRTNNLSEKIIVVAGKVEEIAKHIPEKVDAIISEPMGYLLVNERMLESFVYARRFLKEGGKMFPSKADLHFALFSDEALYLEQSQRCSFWCQDSFHGVNLTALRHQAYQEIFSQPVVDSWNIGILISKTVKWSFDFEKDSVEKLHNIDIPFQLQVSRTCFLHGLASWFDVAFLGTSRKIWLSTSPTEPLTHWYQVRCLLQAPVMVYSGQTVKGRLVMTANDKQSYDLKMQIEVNGIQHLNTLDLKTPHFRYNGQSTNLSPPGAHAECPSDQFLQQQTYQYQSSENSAGDSMSLESIPVPPGLSQMTHSTDKKGTFNGFSQSLMTKLIEDENIGE